MQNIIYEEETQLQGREGVDSGEFTPLSLSMYTVVTSRHCVVTSR